MGWLIGMDEAGYGPNLGPLVVAATSWSVPGKPRQFDLRAALQDVICDVSKRGESRLCIADSKQVYSPQKGIARLELGVLAMLQQIGHQPQTLNELWELLAAPDASRPEDEPWYTQADIQIPHAAAIDDVNRVAKTVGKAMRAAKVKLTEVTADIMLGQRFNRIVREVDSKGICLSRTSMQLIKQLWDPHDRKQTHVIADKHGGRNRYDELLAEILDGEMIFRMEEGRERSEYRIGEATVVFRTKAECHMPVAMASMIAKYTRELAMVAFNNYWAKHTPGLRPTKGYPQDARRFRSDIAKSQKRLKITNDVLWRER